VRHADEANRTPRPGNVDRKIQAFLIAHRLHGVWRSTAGKFDDLLLNVWVV
jgi:hypothetical protein